MPIDPQATRTTKTSRIWLENGILFSEIVYDAHIDLAEAKQITEVFLDLGGGRAHPLLVDFGKIKSQTKEARDYFANDPKHLDTYCAVAILVDNAVARVIANFFMGLNRPKRPTRLFTNRPEALAWLEQFKTA